MFDLPFDVSVHFNSDLRNVANNAAEMEQALAFMHSQLQADGLVPGSACTRPKAEPHVKNIRDF